MIPVPAPTTSRREDAGFERESLQQPLWHVVALTILTCSGYILYWFYKNWRDLAEDAVRRKEAGYGDLAIAQFENKSCLLRTIGLIVPVLNIYLAISQLKGLAELHPDESSLPHRHPLVSSGLVLAAMIGFSCLARLPGAYFLLSLAICVPVAIAQSWLNAYWSSREEQPLQIRHAFSVKELVAIVIGSLILGLVTAGFFIVPPDFERTHQAN